MIPTPRKDERIRLDFTKRKRRVHVFHKADVIREKNDLDPNEVQKRTTTCHPGFLGTLVLVFVGTCSAVYLIFIGTKYSLGAASHTNVSLVAEPSTSTPAERSTPSQGAKVFTVDRSILEKLEYLHKTSGDLDELDIVAWNGRWPPLVTRLPEPRLPHKKPVSYEKAIELCGPRSVTRIPCHFLLPYRIAEQESKARQHLLQLIALAQALNRILVLPNVGKSRMGACLGWEFEAYYDITSLKELGVAFVKMDDFKAWIDLRRNTSSAALMVIAEKSNATFDATLGDQHPSYQDFYIRSTDNMPDIGCIKGRFPNVNFVNRGAISLDVVYPRRDAALEVPYHFVRAVQNAVSVLVMNETGPQIHLGPEILTIDWNLRHAIFPSSLSALRYSPRFGELSREISPSEPYLAVHWRTETVPHENLPHCAHALINKIRDILRDSVVAEGIGTVWLASDLSFDPLRNSVSKSGTLKMLTASHQEAIRRVQASFQADGELAKWKLRSLEQSLNVSHSRDLYDVPWLNDAGVRGILDKIVAAEATVFISGTKRCSHVSSYTRQIIEMRRRSQKLGVTRQRNIVDLFG